MVMESLHYNKNSNKDNNRTGEIFVNLMGGLNKHNKISPRLDVQLKDLGKWQNDLLPPCLVSLY